MREVSKGTAAWLHGFVDNRMDAGLTEHFPRLQTAIGGVFKRDAILPFEEVQ
jgi:hypothetical protein